MEVLRRCLVSSTVRGLTLPATGRPRLFTAPAVRTLSNETSSQEACKINPDSKVKVLYDGHCPLCVSEINLLKMKNKKTQTVDFIDITKADYDPKQNSDIGYDKAMEVMHVIGKDGKVHTRVDAMKAMYGAIGWGWVWNFTNNPTMGRLTDKAYDWFAKNRLLLTGRWSQARKTQLPKTPTSKD